MSVVIAIKHKNKIYMGCDSQATCGQMKEPLPPEHGKVFYLKSTQPYNVLVGGVGSLRDLQIISLEDGFIDKSILYENRLDYEHLVKHGFVNIFNILAKYNRIDRDKNGELVNYINDKYIIAYKDNAWMIGQDGVVTEINDYLVCGSGETVAVGSLEHSKNCHDPIKRIRDAIKACADTTIYVDNNVVVSTT